MKKITIFLSATILLFALFAITAFKPFKPGPSANGQGMLNLAYMGGIPQTFSFHASTNAGVTTGSWESSSPGQDCRTHGTITCLTVGADGKTATMTGVVTQSAGTCLDAAPVGTTVWFRVVDNGEGANATPDEFSDYFLGESLDCTLDIGVPLFPIIGGNIQVKP